VSPEQAQKRLRGAERIRTAVCRLRDFWTRSSRTAGLDGFFVRVRRDWRGETYFGYWVGRPWRCRLTGHRMARREFATDWEIGVEEAWSECERCETFGGYLPLHPVRVLGCSQTEKEQT
jgi:hypothetical protein